MSNASGPSGVAGDIRALLKRVDAERGVDLSRYRPTYVERRFAARMRSLGMRTYHQYGAYLDEHPDEYSELMDALTINVTEFFRDMTVYDRFVQRVVPALIIAKEASRQRSIRIWCAACATGEEPYSIAMALNSAFHDRLEGFNVSVVGTDIDPRALSKARAGRYPIARLEQIPRRYRSGNIEVHDDTFLVAARVRDLVRFGRLNLFCDEPIHKVDVLFCRNVFIYFPREQQRQVSEAFLRALQPGGYLILGRSERLDPSLQHHMETVDSMERIYQKFPS